MVIDNCYIEVLEGELLEDEAARYVARGREKYGDRLKGIKAKSPNSADSATIFRRISRFCSASG